VGLEPDRLALSAPLLTIFSAMPPIPCMRGGRPVPSRPRKGCEQTTLVALRESLDAGIDRWTTLLALYPPFAQSADATLGDLVAAVHPLERLRT